MLIIGQVNEFTPFTETGNLRLFPPPMMQIVQYACETFLLFHRRLSMIIGFPETIDSRSYLSKLATLLHWITMGNHFHSIILFLSFK